jgi:nucleoside-diphosphate-sugar epimerase
MSDNRLIVVIGATGVQGRGVVEQLLADKDCNWNVRALTRNTTSAGSKKLLSDLQTHDHRLSLTEAYVHDFDSLNAAFAGAYGVFGMTSNQKEPGVPLLTEEDVKHEVVAGENMIKAIKKNGVQHFVFSSLPDIIKASNGKFRGAINMNNKVEIEKLARRELEGFTAIVPGKHVDHVDHVDHLDVYLTSAGNFYTNLYWPMYTRTQGMPFIHLMLRTYKTLV